MTFSRNLSKNILWGIIFFSVFVLPNFSWMIRIPITFASLVFILHQTQLTITSDQLEYKIKLFKFSIFHKVLKPEHITQVKFGRIGWAKKNAVVKVRRGFNFGVAHFYNEQLITELEGFALANNIEVKKTKDYQLLEKYFSNN